MPTYHLAVYECDTEGCGHTVVANDMVVARTEAAEQGWQVRGAIQCKDHRQYDPCVECERPMRPWSTTKELHPDTVAQGGNGRCSTCTARKRRGKSSAARTQDVKFEAAVNRYLSVRTPEFRELFEAGVSTEEAKRAAPADLWEVLGI